MLKRESDPESHALPAALPLQLRQWPLPETGEGAHSRIAFVRLNLYLSSTSKAAHTMFRRQMLQHRSKIKFMRTSREPHNRRRQTDTEDGGRSPPLPVSVVDIGMYIGHRTFILAEVRDVNMYFYTLARSLRLAWPRRSMPKTEAPPYMVIALLPRHALRPSSSKVCESKTCIFYTLLRRVVPV